MADDYRDEKLLSPSSASDQRLTQEAQHGCERMKPEV